MKNTVPQDPSSDEARQLLNTFWEDGVDPSQRLGFAPSIRIPFLMAATSIITIPLGLFKGTNRSGLKYLAENTHRLPTTVQGWYYYHKQRNYVVIRDGIVEAVKFGGRNLAFVTGIFGIEALMDYARGQMDFVNTVIGTSIVGFVYSYRQRHLPMSQVRSTVKYGARAGLVFGLLQDGLQAAKGNLWYFNLIQHHFFPNIER
ncbi:hypothetical protein V1512DRAFT_268183 [Lipomyces arxii]|uniref:uncharacterized protein n=1 Tax=Lipomyces arxii TaxID=56418 RepID=UPI0034CF5616